MANEFVIKNGFHSKGDSQVTGSLEVSGGITGSLLGSSSYTLTASYVNLAVSASYISPTFISASAAASGFGAGGGSGAGFPYAGNAVITGSLLVSQSGVFVTGTLSTNRDAVVNNIDIGLGLGSSNTNLRLGTDALDNTIPGTVSGYDVGRYNSAIGYQALQNNRSGSFNTAIGYNALNTLGSGSFDKTAPGYLTSLDATNNTAIGYYAAYRLESGSRNTAIGTNALYHNKNAGGNVAIGYNSMLFYGQNQSFPSQSAQRKNIAIGDNTLRGVDGGANSSENNVAIGSGALINCTTGRYNIGIGTNTLTGNPLTAEGNIAIGLQAMQVTTTGYTNIALGVNALNNLTTGYQNTAIGGNALKRISVERNHVAIGINAMEFASSSVGDNNFSNVSIGVEAGRYMVGSRNVALGYQAMYQSSGSLGARLSVAIGYQALYGAGGGAQGDYNMAIGYRAMYSAGSVGQNLAFGYSSLETLKEGTGNLIIGNRAAQFMSASNDVLAIGRVALQNAKRVQQVIAIGESAMLNQYPTDTGTMLTAASVAIGFKALQGAAGNTNIGIRNTAIGDNSSQFNSTGNDNTTIGYGTLNQNLTGINNVAVGSGVLFYATGSDNTSIGYYSGRLISGNNNVAIGSYALNVQYSGSLLNSIANNTAIGYGAGRYISASTGNVFIGYNAGPPGVGGDARTTVNNQLYISNTTGNPLIGGDFSAKTVTISGSLYISGSIIPNAGATLTSSFELGSPTAAWNRIWVRSSSIHFVDDSGNELAKISANTAGAIEMPSIYTSGTFTAQTFVTQSTTTIIEVFHATGSNQFGSSSLDTHQFTGSVYISGSLNQTAGSTTTRNATINGNLVTTGSVQFTGLQESSQNYLVSIDATTGQLYYTASSAFTPNAIDPSAFATTGSNNFYGNQTIYDSDSIVSIETSTGIRRLYDFNTNTSIDWANRVLYDNLNIPSINYNSRELRDESSTTLLEYSNNQVRLTQDVLMTGLSQDIADSVITIDTVTGQLYTTSSTAFVANIGDVATYLGPLNDFSASILAFTSSIQTQVNSLTASTSSYVLNSATSSISVLSSSYALTASYALNVPTVDTSALVGTASFNSFTSSIQGQVDNLTSATSSYTLNSATSSMLAPYVANSATSSMLSPYVLTSSTSSMTVLSSSFASTASFVNRLVQNVIVTGSVTATSFTGSLRGHVVTSSINTSQSVLINNFGTAVDWANSSLGYSSVASVNWASRTLTDSGNVITANWQNKTLTDSNGTSIDWGNRLLRDSSGYISVNYGNRALYNDGNSATLNYSKENKVTTKGPVTTHLYDAFLTETEDTASANFYAGELYQTDSYPNVGNYGELVYLDQATNAWVRIDQTTNVCARYIGIDIDFKIGVLTEGHIIMTDAADPFSGGIPQIENPLIGMPVYIKESATGLFNDSYTCNIPASGYVRVIGHVMYRAVGSGFESKYMIKLKPSNDWYEI